MKKYSLSITLAFSLALLSTTGCQQDEVADTQGTSPAEDDTGTGYQKVFDKNYEQHQISSRMRSNFEHIDKTLNTSGFHRFASAGVNAYLPENMKPADRFTGFIGKEEARQSTPTFLILTNPFSMKSTTEQTVSSIVHKGSSGIIFTERVNVGGREGVFYFTRESIQDVTIGKYILTFGDDEFSWIMTSTFTKEHEEKYGPELLKVMLNIEIAEERAPPGEDVDFTMSSDSLVLTDGFVDKLLFTLTGKFPEDTLKEPIFQAGRSIIEMEHEDKQAVARQLIPPTADFEVIFVSSEKEIEIDGMQGYEFVSIGRDRLSNEPLMIYSAVIFGGMDSYLMHGWFSSDNETNYIENFRGLAQSFRRKSKTTAADPVVVEEPTDN